MFSSIFFPNLKKNPITLQIHIISVISFDTAPCIVRDLKGNFFVRLDKFWILALLCKLKKSVKTFDSTFLQLLWVFSVVISHGASKHLLKLENILQQTSWAGWQHSGDKWSEAVLDPLPFTGLESYQTLWTHIDVLQ